MKEERESDSSSAHENDGVDDSSGRSDGSSDDSDSKVGHNLGGHRDLEGHNCSALTTSQEAAARQKRRDHEDALMAERVAKKVQKNIK